MFRHHKSSHYKNSSTSSDSRRHRDRERDEDEERERYRNRDNYDRGDRNKDRRDERIRDRDREDRGGGDREDRGGDREDRGGDRDRNRDDRDYRKERRRSPPRNNFEEEDAPRRQKRGRERDWDNFFQNIDIKSEKIKIEEDESNYEYGQPVSRDGNEPPKEKQKPNFEVTGKLAEETNTFKGVVIKYSEPPEARKPQKIRWRLYPFKGTEALPTMFIHRQSAYLLGRERKIADIPIDHPSCSKQHAIIQYRLMPYEKRDGTQSRKIKPYILDLESANGTYVNGVKIEAKRYLELFEKDVLKFGFSSREYVLLHEHSKDDPEEDEFEGEIEATASPVPEDRAEHKMIKIKKEKD